MEKREYNGWTNKETWLLLLWIGEGQFGGGQYWVETTREQVAQTLADNNAIESALGEAVKLLAGYLEEKVRDDAVDAIPSGFYSDVIDMCVEEIDYRQIAGHWVSDAEAQE